MTAKSQTTVKTEAQPSLNTDKSGLLQRKCDCGNAAGLTGECSECQSKRLTKQPGSMAQNGSAPVLHDLIQPKLTVGAPGDKYEQEADRVAPPIVDQPRPNKTGLPDHLKTGIENLSGLSMDNVKVHTNSSKPGQLQALAYTQGMDIYIGPGQERHMPHEAWHVVQQMQGRVKPTIQQTPTTKINDDQLLEKEADVMGTKALLRMPQRNQTIPQGDHIQLLQNRCDIVERSAKATVSPVHKSASQDFVVQRKVSIDTPRKTRIIITDRDASDYGDIGTVLKRSRKRDRLVVEFDNEEGVGYRVHIDDMDYYDMDYYQPSRREAPSSASFLVHSPEKASLPTHVQRIRELVGIIADQHTDLPFMEQEKQLAQGISDRALADIGVSITEEEMQGVWEQAGIIKLRPTTSEVRKLVIGCGNSPVFEEVLEEGHEHADAYTVDPNIRMRPTVVGLFGRQKISAAFAPQQFETIIFEGVTALTDPADVDKTPYLVTDLKQMLKSGGKATFSFKKPDIKIEVTKVGEDLNITGISPQYEAYTGKTLEHLITAYQSGFEK